jgi:rare lipoprotein A
MLDVSMRAFPSWRRAALIAGLTLALAPAAVAAERPGPQPGVRLTAMSLSPMVGVASWYGGHHIGRRTASGEIHAAGLRTAAHRDLPFGTFVRITNLKNGRSSVAKVNDRGPFVPGRLIDLSEQTARDLAMLREGLAFVRLEVLSRE